MVCGPITGALNNVTLHRHESDRMPSALGTLERVDLRAAWASEAQHFTPWLASCRRSQSSRLMLANSAGSCSD